MQRVLAAENARATPCPAPCGRRAHEAGPAHPPAHPLLMQSVREKGRQALTIWKDMTTTKRTRRTLEAVDTTAMDAMAAYGGGRDRHVGSGHDGVGLDRDDHDDNRGGGGGHRNTACGARHRPHAQLLSCVGGPTRGRLAGQMSRWQAALGADTPATPCGSVARCDGRGRGLAAEVRAHAEDDVDFAMPVSGTTGGHVRAKQEQPVCRRREQRVACVRRRQRHRGRAAPSAESHKSSAERSN